MTQEKLTLLSCIKTLKQEVIRQFESLEERVIALEDHKQAVIPIQSASNEWLTAKKVVFSLLCRYVNLSNRDCFPSIKKLAEKANCSEFSVQKALKKLVELGLIERHERFINGRQTTSLYTIIGFKAPYYKNKSETEGGSTKLTPPPSTLT